MKAAERDLIEAEFLRQVYVAERMRQARLAGHLPVPVRDPLGDRLRRLAQERRQPTRS